MYLQKLGKEITLEKGDYSSLNPSMDRETLLKQRRSAGIATNDELLELTQLETEEKAKEWLDVLKNLQHAIYRLFPNLTNDND